MINILKILFPGNSKAHLAIFLRLKNNSKMNINIIGDQVHSKSKT